MQSINQSLDTLYIVSVPYYYNLTDGVKRISIDITGLPKCKFTWNDALMNKGIMRVAMADNSVWFSQLPQL